MALPASDCDREAGKFVETTSGKVAVRTLVEEFLGTIDAVPSGLTIGGKITEVTLNSSTWTALPATALTDRNGLGVQNPNAIKIKLNFDSGVGGFVGWTVNENGETFLDITDSVILYAKSESGTPVVTVMEVA